jgi:hypothetical protein
MSGTANTPREYQQQRRQRRKNIFNTFVSFSSTHNEKSITIKTLMAHLFSSFSYFFCIFIFGINRTGQKVYTQNKKKATKI